MEELKSPRDGGAVFYSAAIRGNYSIAPAVNGALAVAAAATQKQQQQQQDGQRLFSA